MAFVSVLDTFCRLAPEAATLLSFESGVVKLLHLRFVPPLPWSFPSPRPYLPLSFPS
jgi:hypothetical protein